MTDDAIQGMRRAYAANVSVIDHAVGRILGALEARGMLDDTWVLYTSDHGEMGGNHGLMSKCVLYEQAVRVPLIVRPARGCDAACRRLAGRARRRARDRARDRAAPRVPETPGRSLLGYVHGTDPRAPGGVDQRELGLRRRSRPSATSSSSTRTRCSPCQLFDLHDDPNEDETGSPIPSAPAVVEELMEDARAPVPRHDPGAAAPEPLHGLTVRSRTREAPSGTDRAGLRRRGTGMELQAGDVAVVTGAASGIGLRSPSASPEPA